MKLTQLLDFLLLLFSIEILVIVADTKTSDNDNDKEEPFVMGHTSGVYDQSKKAVNIKKIETISPSIVNATGRHLEELECWHNQRYCTAEKDNNFNEPYLNSYDHYANKCSCSSDCHEYGDCCMDTPLPDEGDPIPVPCYECQHVMLEIGHRDLYAISRCPEEWQIEDVRDQCESQMASSPLMELFVTGVHNNVTYRNVFCAVCQGQRKLIPWEVVFRCPVENSTNQTLDRDSEFRKKCPYFYRNTVDPNLSYSVPCNADNFISHCSPMFNRGPNAEFNEKMCPLFYAPVTTKDDMFPKRYKNKFCAFCNGESHRGLKCDSNTMTYMTTHFHDDFGPQFGVKATSGVSYSVLLDIDFMTGGSVVGTTRKCPPGDIYDPWSEMCRSVLCGEKYVYSDGICVANGTQVVDQLSQNDSVSFNSCPKMLTTEKYHLDENGTLVFDHKGLSLENGQYEIRDNQTVMICILADVFVSKFGETQGTLTLACICVSLVALFLKIVFHVAIPNTKKVAANAIASLSVSIFIAQLLFLVGVSHNEWGVGCKIVGILIHYFFLASFFWTNTLAFDIWMTFSCVRMPKSPNSARSEGRTKLIQYSCYAWLSPLVVIVIAIVIDFAPIKLEDWKPGYGQQICWLSNRRALLVFFAAPLAALLLVNFSFFACTAFKIATALRASKFVHENTGKRDCIRFGLYIKLALIMGLTWTFGFVAPFSGSDVLWCLFIVLNGLQGAFILLAFTEFKRLWKALRSVKSGSDSSTKSTGNSRASDSSRNNLATSMTNVTGL